MSKKQTIGQLAANEFRHILDDEQYAEVVSIIDRYACRRMAKAWDDGYAEGQMGGTPENPYRAKRRGRA